MCCHWSPLTVMATERYPSQWSTSANTEATSAWQCLDSNSISNGPYRLACRTPA
jgi:hypothetical protein